MRINRAVIGILLSTLAFPAWADEGGRSRSPLIWHSLPSPPQEIALNGTFCGVVGDALVLAGGSTELLDDGPSPDAFSDRVFVLSDPHETWSETPLRLPRPTAFGLSLTCGDTLVCLGGSHGDEHTDAVFELRQVNGRIERSDLPPLPCPAANLCGAVWGDAIYVAGGQTHPDSAQAMKTFWSLDLAAPKRRWKQHEPWPGPARMLAAAAVQGNAFYLFGGCDLDGNSETPRPNYLADAYAFSPQKGWRRVADLPMPWAVTPSPAVAVGQSHLFLLGGATTHRAGGDPHSADGSRYAADLLAYHTITDTWTTLGKLPVGIEPRSPGSRRYATVPIAPTARWREYIVLPVPSPLTPAAGGRILWAEPRQVRTGLDLLDYVILVIYLVSLVGMGIFFARREKNTKDFFLAGQRVPWWAAGISLFGTKLSSLTFMAIPAMVYQTDWTYFLGVLMTIAVAPVIVWVYLPFYRRLNVTSAYEYLEKRFGTGTRLLGSGTFLVLHLARMGVVLYLPALALAAVTGMDVYGCILLIGLLATLYTTLGGIEAVIWTDVLQVIVLMGGALLSFGIIVAAIPGGLAGFISLGVAEGKFQAVNPGWDITTAALWVVVLGNFFANLIPYSSDQTLIQRYLTTSNEKQAARAVWTNAAMTFPAAVFFALGTALWAFYKTNPEQLGPTTQNDQIFPWFIATQLPPGLAGLLIAALFAASMSSLDSSMNSMATTVITDFYRRFHSKTSEAHDLRIARALTLLFGAAGTAAALWIASLQSEQIWRVSFKLVSLLGGGLAGLFVAGIFTRRTTGPGAVVGFCTATVTLYFVASTEAVHFFLYGGIGLLTCAIVAWLTSWILPGHPPDTTGLTIYHPPSPDPP